MSVTPSPLTNGGLWGPAPTFPHFPIGHEKAPLSGGRAYPNRGG